MLPISGLAGFGTWEAAWTLGFTQLGLTPDQPEADGSAGYKKPPRGSRFPPGRSGNPGGRPPGAKGWKKIVDEIANKMHWVNEGGRRRRLSTLELILMFVRNRSLKDKNMKAFRAHHRLLEKYGPTEPQNGVGFLILREQPTKEEWLAEYGPEKDDGGGLE